MAEYIEREAVKAAIKKRLGTMDLFESRFNADIDAIPAADVAPVVKCRDCKWQHTIDCPMNYEVATYDEVVGHDTYMATNACNDDGFCWCGEREDGDDNG